MPIIDYLARGVIQSLDKEDFRRIMNDTLDHMLRVMSKRERMEFIDSMVNNAVAKMLQGMTNEEKAQLLQTLLPKIVAQFPGADVSPPTAGASSVSPDSSEPA